MNTAEKAHLFLLDRTLVATDSADVGHPFGFPGTASAAKDKERPVARDSGDIGNTFGFLLYAFTSC
jgi:hypothetical protein